MSGRQASDEIEMDGRRITVGSPSVVGGQAITIAVRPSVGRREWCDRGALAARSAMLLASPAAALRAKLTEKTRYRPTAAIKPLLPVGVESLEAVPRLAHVPRMGQVSATAMNEYVEAIRKCARAFAKSHRKKGTLVERDNYVVWVDSWARLSGFGEYVIVDDTVRQRRARGENTCEMVDAQRARALSGPAG